MTRKLDATFSNDHGIGTVFQRDGLLFVRWKDYRGEDTLTREYPVLVRRNDTSRDGIAYAAYVKRSGSHNLTINVPKSCIEYARRED